MAASDLTLAAPLNVTTNYGQSMPFSYMHFDAKSQRVEVGWETFNAGWTGKFYRITVDASGTTYYFTDGTTQVAASPKFGDAGVQAVIAQATLGSFGQANVR